MLVGTGGKLIDDVLTIAKGGKEDEMLVDNDKLLGHLHKEPWSDCMSHDAHIGK